MSDHTLSSRFNDEDEIFDEEDFEDESYPGEDDDDDNKPFRPTELTDLTAKGRERRYDPIKNEASPGIFDNIQKVFTLYAIASFAMAGYNALTGDEEKDPELDSPALSEQQQTTPQNKVRFQAGIISLN